MSDSIHSQPTASVTAGLAQSAASIRLVYCGFSTFSPNPLLQTAAVMPLTSSFLTYNTHATLRTQIFWADQWSRAVAAISLNFQVLGCYPHATLQV